MKSVELKDWLKYSHSSYSLEDDPFGIFNPRPNLEFETKVYLFSSYLEHMEVFLVQGIEKRIQEFKEAIDQQDMVVAKELKKLEEERGAWRVSSDPQTRYDYEQMESSIFHQYSFPLSPDEAELYWIGEMSEFADMLRKSFFVNLYGYWESQVFPLCNSLKELYGKEFQDDKKFKIKTAKEFKVEDANPFLGEIGFPISGNTWNVIKKYAALRNCIIHHNGEIGRVTGKKDRRKLETLILSEQPLLSLKDQDDILLNERDAILVQEGKPQFYSKKTLFNSDQVDLKKGDVILDQAKRTGIVTEAITLLRNKKNSGVKVNIIEENEKIVFRKGKTIVCPTGEPTNFQKDEAIIFRDERKIIFRQKVNFHDGSKLILNQGFCEKALGTIERYFDELLGTLAAWDSKQKTS